MMLARRKPVRSGIARAPQRSFPKHEQFVRGFVCSAFKADPDGCSGKIECCHVRSGTGGGVAIKPASWWTVPMCAQHHALQHAVGESAFEKRFGIDLRALALQLARLSSDVAMREAMTESGVP